MRRGESEMLVTLKPGAVGAGVTTFDLARQLRGSFQGLLSDQIQVGNEEYDVEVRYSDKDRDSIEDLENYLVTLPGGKTIPIQEVAQISYRRGWSRIARINGRRIVNVYASVDSEVSNSNAIIQKLRTEKMPEVIKRHPDLVHRFRGEAEKGAETGSSMAIAAAIGCLGVFVILSFQFRSYIEPVIVMVAIPFALVGVILGHWLFGLNLSLPSFMGYASLAGIVVNDSILLVLFLKSARAEGRSPSESGVEATKTRFRAVMITSLTTVAGLMPLLLEKSLQAQILIPIAISICFGLMASTILVLLVIPPFYVILADFGLTAKLESGD
jgi:multidrug efflux pump subunit AcrB